VGLSFTETMKGFLQKGAALPAPEDLAAYVAAERAGQQANTYMEFTLTIAMPNLDVFLADAEHPGIASGTVRVDGFTGPAGVPVNAGLFNLFVETGRAYDRRMLYALPFVGGDGQPYLLDGFKVVHDDGRFDVWGATSTLYTVIRAGHARTGTVLACGILHILVTDFNAATRDVHGLGHRRSRAQGGGARAVRAHVHGYVVGRVRAAAALAVVPLKRAKPRSQSDARR
jgi:cholesterol oxidase